MLFLSGCFLVKEQVSIGKPNVAGNYTNKLELDQAKQSGKQNNELKDLKTPHSTDREMQSWVKIGHDFVNTSEFFRLGIFI